ncbi:Aste57867_19951 [Aphanomyces stellatus]|uniref:Aste57867_19951 protein n=1 Tax=Aphanomyces stellatus TaxID=120398 RepID=A0A485LDQ4_9STRA|nr:hypothetical protein As57867_019885 [Aphanomyces stellatus]VFT96648.1 Aste57867_19951 [Aphanomyces stellatus]
MGAEGSFEVFTPGELEQEYETRAGKGDLNLWRALEKGYNKAVEQLIQPPRKQYKLEALGPTEFNFVSTGQPQTSLTPTSPRVRATRRDFVLPTATHDLHGSFWSLQRSTSTHPPPPCIVYLHSNMGSRLDALSIREYALGGGCHLAAFDFGGSGMSTGTYITGGLREATDLRNVLAYLQTTFHMERFLLWGHSLGAAAILLYLAEEAAKKTKAASESPHIHGVVLDSPYTTFQDMTESLIQTVKANGLPAPAPLLRLGMSMVTRSIEARAGFKLQQVNPLQSSKQCTTPALFCTGKQDLYVKTTVANQFMAAYGGPRSRIAFDGDHYGPRPPELKEFAMAFFLETLESS